MEQVLRNDLYYIVEFMKLLLAAVYFLRLQPKKRLVYIFAGSLLLVCIVTYWIDLQEISYVYIPLEIAVLWVCMKGKWVGLRLLLGVVAITLVDVIIGA